LTPRKAVLAAIAEAHEYDSFLAWQHAVLRLPRFDQPLTLLVDSVRSGIRSDNARNTDVVLDPAARRRSRQPPSEEYALEDERASIDAAAVAEVVFLWDLHLTTNQFVADQLRRSDAGLRDLLMEGRALVKDAIAAWAFFTSLSPSMSELQDRPAVPFDLQVAVEQVETALTRGPRWLERAGEALTVLRAVQAAVVQLDREYFDGVGVLFEAERERLKQLNTIVELMRDMVVRSEMLMREGDVEREVPPSSSTAHEISRGLVIAARVTRHMVVGEIATARALAVEFLDTVGSGP